MKKILLTIGLFSFTLFFAQKSENYLQIGYSSICCGTPSDKPVMDFVNQFQKKNKIKALEIYKQSGLGREGEYNLYIGMDKLSKTQKTNFVRGLKTAIDSQNNSRSKNRDGIVNFSENEMVQKADLSNARNLTLYKK
ncbi:MULTISPECIES: hypothetical protein [Chryseobacterium]|uniref:Uncharacterized protein n=1 Tax=Chryseobacterium geocarposphaerae TaxID=1416776 RepID=A0ABU1LC14_9FLAO|nr:MULTISPECIES: hypothetical protein [Chryseobacterium]MDR6404135.1 hypothetical protein [Chryseobacterium geocarposphaerae]MDR6698346.1 hypothetical protein [Chryseobacterium ginsenosidimutans]